MVWATAVIFWMIINAPLGARGENTAVEHYTAFIIEELVNSLVNQEKENCMSDYKEDELKAQLEMLLGTYSTDLQDAVMELDKQTPGTAEYDSVLGKVATMTTTYNEFCRRYTDIYYPTMPEKEKWYERTDWGRVLTNALLILASVGQSIMIYKWQRDGYLVKNDSIRIQMPKY